MIKDLIPSGICSPRATSPAPAAAARWPMRLVLKELGRADTVVVLPACCWSIIAGPYPQSSLQVPLYHTAFETGAAVASGVRARARPAGRHARPPCWCGRATAAPSTSAYSALSGAAERNENFLYVCYDNEAYMNTGIQRSSATPRGAWTTTTPTTQPQSTLKKDILGIVAAHRIPYAATATVAYPVDLINKVRRAKETKGFRFLHILAPCPPGWKFPDEQSIEMARLAVRTRVFPLLEVEDGVRWRFTTQHAHEPVEGYLSKQGRFRHLTPEAVQQIQADVDARWEQLRQRVAGSG